PWDSEHNKKLLARMPKVYAPPVPGKTKVPYGTFYQAFTGPNTLFGEGPIKYKIGNIPDGTSNTLLFVEAGEAVPWTKPEDITINPKKPLPKLGGPFKDFFNAAYADGSVRAIKKTIKEDVLRLLIDPADGMPIPDFD